MSPNNISADYLAQNKRTHQRAPQSPLSPMQINGACLLMAFGAESVHDRYREIAQPRPLENNSEGGGTLTRFTIATAA